MISVGLKDPLSNTNKVGSGSRAENGVATNTQLEWVTYPGIEQMLLKVSRELDQAESEPLLLPSATVLRHSRQHRFLSGYDIRTCDSSSRSSACGGRTTAVFRSCRSEALGRALLVMHLNAYASGYLTPVIVSI